MSGRGRRKAARRVLGRQGQRTSVEAEEPQYCVVRVATGEAAGLPVLLLHVSEADVADAREQVRQDNAFCLRVLQVLYAFLSALGHDPETFEWSMGNYLELLDLLGMPVALSWTERCDAELTDLLAGAAQHTTEGGSHGR